MSGTLQPFFITDRLLLRPWEFTDASILFKYASDPEIGPMAGWAPHTSMAYSENVIRTLLSRPGEYAVVPKDVREPVGSVDIKFGSDGNICLEKGEMEVGYWIGRPYWGRGYIPEAVDALTRYAFTELGIERIWCLCRTDNRNSMRVQDKCGFSFVREGTVNTALYGPITMRFTCITREEWTDRHPSNC